MTENLIISQEKIQSIPIEMTPRNAELNGEFNDIRLKIHIEPKIGETKKKTRHLEEKICLYYRKFDNFRRENSLNWNSNDTDKSRIQW